MSNASEEGARVVPILPLSGGEKRRRPGRPKKVERAPTQADLEHHAHVAAAQAEHVDADEVVRAVVEQRNPRVVLQEVAEALSREAAVLEFQRRQLELRGRDVGQIVSRRANILVELTRLQVRIQELNPTVLDLRSEAMARVFKELMITIAKVADEVLPPQHFDVFFNRLENELEGWEDQVESKLR